MNFFKTTTDDTLMETVQHGSSTYPFAFYLEDIWQFDFHHIDWHWHHELEFIYVMEGTALCLIGNEQIYLPKGCGLFINSGILHRYEARNHTMIPNIVFSPDLLASETSIIYQKYIQPIITSSISYQMFIPQTDWQNSILQTLVHIFSLQESDKKNELQTLQLLLQIWNILFHHLDLSSDALSSQHLNHRQAKLQTMMQFIHEHYAFDLTLDEIASSVSVSRSGALDIFNSYIRTSPVAYLIQYRLTQAAKLLRATEKPISVIAEETGFKSSGYFCRKFRQSYCMTPNEYRHKKTHFTASSYRSIP